MTHERLESVAARYDALVSELNVAAAHARDCATHIRDGNVPRCCAHAFALEGHLRIVQSELAALSIDHAEHSTPMPRAQ